jgi:hypothetical protein
MAAVVISKRRLEKRTTSGVFLLQFEVVGTELTIVPAADLFVAHVWPLEWSKGIGQAHDHLAGTAGRTGGSSYMMFRWEAAVHGIPPKIVH